MVQSALLIQGGCCFCSILRSVTKQIIQNVISKDSFHCKLIEGCHNQITTVNWLNCMVNEFCFVSRNVINNKSVREMRIAIFKKA